MATTTKQRKTKTSNNRKPTQQQQADRFAKQAAKKVDERREAATGAAGWVAERAGKWDLDGLDPRFMDLQKFFWNPLIDYWFRMDVDGWENIPEPPVLLVRE